MDIPDGGECGLDESAAEYIGCDALQESHVVLPGGKLSISVEHERMC